MTSDNPPTDGPMTPPEPAAPVAPPPPDPVFSIPPPRPRRRITLTSALLAGAALVALAGVAFAVGRVTAPSATPTGFGRAFANGGNGGQFPGNGNGGGSGGGGFGGSGGIDLRGTVTAVNGDTLTIQLANGRTVEVKTSSATTYHTQQAGSASDVTSGASVVVQVTADGGLRGLFGQGGNGGTVTLPAGDVTVTGR